MTDRTRSSSTEKKAQRDVELDGVGEASSLPQYLPARMVNEYVYCPRLFYYEWVDGLFAHNADTIEGKARHKKMESKSDPLKPAGTDEPVHSRSVELSSDRYGVIAKIDLIEGDGDSVRPVEYKKGRPCNSDCGPTAWPSDRVQVGIQALVLRDNGYCCDEAILYYSQTRQRVRLAVDDELESEVVDAIRSARETAASDRYPPPLVDSPKCPRCSLVGICMPDETSCASYFDDSFDESAQLKLFDGANAESGAPEASDELVVGQADDLRRLVPARHDLKPLYLAGHDIVLGKTGEVLRAKRKGKKIQDVRIREISQVNLFGNVQLTAQAIRALCVADKPIAHFSYGGWFYGTTQGLGLKNVFLRRNQFQLAEISEFCVRVARRLVFSKIRNQRKLLQRNHIEPPSLVLKQLNRYADAALRCESLDTLLGIEGRAARLYFGNFHGLLKATGDEEHTNANFSFDFRGRNRRPPRDPVNALLSLGYAVLTKDVTVICHNVGFDPFYGFFHRPRFGRPSLALDLMEPFRPLIADSAVITAINTRMVTPDDFMEVGNAVSLTPKGRKAFLRAYEQRMDTLVTHPEFGYRVNYHRILEIQTRLLARVVNGEISVYTGFETR